MIKECADLARSLMHSLVAIGDMGNFYKLEEDTYTKFPFKFSGNLQTFMKILMQDSQNLSFGTTD